MSDFANRSDLQGQHTARVSRGMRGGSTPVGNHAAVSPTRGSGVQAGQTPENLAEQQPDPAADPLLSPRFRILQRGGWKRALKLEEIFWRSLEYLAGRKGQKLTDYLRSQLEARPDIDNQSSFLRAHAACGIMEELEETQKQLARFGSRGVLQAVPMPGFIVAEGLGLAGYNNEFLGLVRKLAAMGEGDGQPQARLNFDLPVAGIKSALKERQPQPVECGFALMAGSRRCRGRVRVCLVPGPSNREDLMGFIVALHHQDREADKGDAVPKVIAHQQP